MISLLLLAEVDDVYLPMLLWPVTVTRERDVADAPHALAA
jgi:hypothetical protein